MTPLFSSIPVEFSEFAVVRPWIFPKDRFFEWEPKDEDFCRRNGFGHEGPGEPAIFLMPDAIIVHPSLREAFEALNLQDYHGLKNCRCKVIHFGKSPLQDAWYTLRSMERTRETLLEKWLPYGWDRGPIFDTRILVRAQT